MKYVAGLLSIVVLIYIGFLIHLNFGDCPHVLRRLSSAIRNVKYVPAADIDFDRGGLRMAAEWNGPRGSQAGGSSYKSSDCVRVEQDMYSFSNPIDAEEQFHEWLSSATKVIVTSDVSTGERAVFQNSKEPHFQILSKEKNSVDVYSITSESLEHALLYEKRKAWLKLPSTASVLQPTSHENRAPGRCPLVPAALSLSALQSR